MSAYDVFLEVTLSATERWSMFGTSIENANYEKRIESVSTVSKAIRPGGGVMQVGNGSVTLEDPDGKLRKLAGTENFRNADAVVKLRRLDTGQMITLLDGYVRQKRTPPGKFVLDLRDSSLDIFKEKVKYRVTADIFSNVPDRTPAKLIPIPFGTVDSTSFGNRGHIPAYLVDPAVGGSKFKYVAAQVAVSSIDEVFRYGESVDSSYYTVTYENLSIGGQTVRMAFINFDVDQRERGRGWNEITWDGGGLTADPDDENESLLTNPASILEKLLELQGTLVSSTDIDQTLLAAAETAYSNAGIVAAGAVTDENDDWQKVIDRFGTLNLNFWRTNSGLYAMRFDDALAPSSTKVHHMDGRDILANTFHGWDAPDTAATLELHYARDHARADWDAYPKEVNDSTAQTQLGREVVRKQQLWYARDINDSQSLGERKLFQERPERLYQSYSILPDLNLELGDGLEVTHFGGESSDGAGFRRKTFILYGSKYSVTRNRAAQELHVVDAPGLTPTTFSDSEPSRQSTDIVPIIQGYHGDLVFYEVDYNTVAWSQSSDEHIWEPGPNYTEHTITNGNTGNMSAGTVAYAYWDPGTSKTALQITTDLTNITDDPQKVFVARFKPGADSDHSPVIEPATGFGFVVLNEDSISVPELSDVQSDTGNVDVQSGVDVTVKSGGGITIEDGGDIVLNAGATPAEIIFSGVGTFYSKSGSSALYIYPSFSGTKALRIGDKTDSLVWGDVLVESDKIWLYAYASGASPFAEIVMDGNGITSKGDLFPDSDDTDTCGKVGNRWADVRSVLINGADICFENGWKFREFGASDEDIHKPAEWIRSQFPGGIQLMNPDGEVVAVFHKSGLYVDGPVRDIEELVA